MRKLEQNSNIEFINKFILAFRNVIKDYNTISTFDLELKENISNMVMLQNNKNIFYLFEQNYTETIYILNKKYLKYIKDKKYKTKNDIIFKDKNNKISESLKSKNNFLYKKLYGEIWKEEKKQLKKYILKFNTIFIELDQITYYDLFNDAINSEKNKSIQQLNDLSYENDEKSVMDIIYTLKDIIGDDIFKL